MMNMRFNKWMGSLAILPVMWLTACDNSDLSGDPPVPVYENYIQEALAAETKISFQLQGAEATVAVPTFLLVDQTTGRLNVPTTSTDLSDPSVALNQTDGWGPTEPIVLTFTGKELDPSTVVGSFEMIKISDPLTTPPDQQTPVRLTPTYNPTEPTPGADFLVLVSPSSPNQLTVLLLKPLDPASNYMYAVTNNLKDVDGNSVGFTGSYAALKSQTPTSISSLVQAQQIIQLGDLLFSAVGVDNLTITYSTWFTTGSAGDVMYGTKGINAGALEEILNGRTAAYAWSGTANPKNLDLVNLYFMETTALSETQGNIEFYKGTVSLPHFLNREPENSAWAKTPWAAGMPSLAILINTLTTGSSADVATLTTQLEALDPPLSVETVLASRTDPAAQAESIQSLTGALLTLADGSQLDSERIITRFSPIPQVRYQRTLETLIAIPSIEQCSGRMPVSIYVHGITADKETLEFLANNLIGEDCLAVVAIDLPLHGSRGIQDGDTYIVTNAANPGVFLNLQYLPVGRDNLRQSVVDQIALRLALGMQFALNTNSESPRDIDPDDPLTRITNDGNLGSGVGLVGHSLGAIVGLGYSSIANRPVTENEVVETLYFKNSRLLAANPGGTIAYFLLDSGQFGNFLKDQILEAQSAAYRAYKQANCPSETVTGPECYAMYFDTLTPEQQAAVIQVFTQFAFAGQTVISGPDPVNLVSQIPTEIPTFMFMVENDQVIPNILTFGVTEVYSALAGTLPMIFNTPFTQITDSVATPLRDAALFNQGNHASFLEALIGDPVGVEMQTEANSFFNEGVITVTNRDLLYTVPQP